MKIIGIVMIAVAAFGLVLSLAARAANVARFGFDDLGLNALYAIIELLADLLWVLLGVALILLDKKLDRNTRPV